MDLSSGGCYPLTSRSGWLHLCISFSGRGNQPEIQFMSTCSHLGVLSKLEGPSTCLNFLGIEVDTNAMQLRLPADKLLKLKLALSQSHYQMWPSVQGKFPPPTAHYAVHWKPLQPSHPPECGCKGRCYMVVPVCWSVEWHFHVLGHQHSATSVHPVLRCLRLLGLWSLLGQSVVPS